MIISRRTQELKRRHGIILAVIERELAIWRKRPLYVLGSIVPLVFSMVFYVSFFRAGMPEDLPIGVVDLDDSSLSRNFIRQLDATQLGKVIHFESFSQAREAMQRGKITSVCVLPDGMYEDVVSNRQPKFTFYINGLYFVGGSLAYKDILTMINLTAGAVQREALRARGVNEHVIGGILRPIDLDTHQIGNPTTDYGVYLVNGMMPGILQMTVILILVYSLGTELKYGTSHHLLEVTDGSIALALIGKCHLYTVYFCLLGWLMLFTLYGWLGFPLAGSIGWLMLGVVMLVLASEAIAIAIIGFLPVCRFALSVSALYSILGFSMAGFSLPVESLIPEIQGLACIFPLRHYYQLFVSEGIYDAGFAGVYPEMMHLMVFLIMPYLVIRRLGDAYVKLDYPKN